MTISASPSTVPASIGATSLSSYTLVRSSTASRSVSFGSSSSTSFCGRSMTLSPSSAMLTLTLITLFSELTAV